MTTGKIITAGFGNTANSTDETSGETSARTALASAGPSLPELRNYAARKAKGVLAQTWTYTISGVGTSLTTMLDPASFSDLQRMALNGVQHSGESGTTEQYLQANGQSVVALNAAQAGAFGKAALATVTTVYATLGTVLSGITGGTITTFAQINSASWPTP